MKVLSSPTEDIGKLLAVLHGLNPGGANHFVEGIKVAMVRRRRCFSLCWCCVFLQLRVCCTIQLALRHRRNKHGSQRIVSFVGSPVDADEKVLKRLGALLRKNNVRVVRLSSAF